MSTKVENDNDLKCEILDRLGNPVGEDFLSPEGLLKFKKVFNRFLENGDIGEGIKFYAHKDGRRTAFYTEKFYIHLGDAWDSSTSYEFAFEPLVPIFVIWCKEA